MSFYRRHQVSRSTYRRPRRSLVVIGTISITIALCVTAYYLAATASTTNFPFACNLPPSFQNKGTPRIPTTNVSPAAIPQPQLVEDPETRSCPPAETAEIILQMAGAGDTLMRLLTANKADKGSAELFARKLAEVISQESGKSGFRIDTPISEKGGTPYSIAMERATGKILRVTLELNPVDVFHAELVNGNVKAWKEEVVVEFRTETVTVKIEGSLSESLTAAGEGIELAGKLGEMFKYDIDFNTECRRGDVCKVLFQRKYTDDRPTGYGEILCAVYDGSRTGKKVAVRFNGRDYDANGKELLRQLLRSPLQIPLRVTSRFGTRIHPIYKVRKMHKGVDYGAPIGTRVVAVSKGRIVYAGWAKGYGRYVRILHSRPDGKREESRYGHLSKIFVKKGQRVDQGQTIGLVGQSGVATGPHLDFQLVVSGRHTNPERALKRAKRMFRPLPGDLHDRFDYVKSRRFHALGFMPYIRSAEKDSPPQRSQ